MRNTGKLCFATLQDGDGTQVQAMLSLAEVGKERLDAWKSDVDLGDFISVRGRVISSRRGELSIMVSEWTMAAKSLPACASAITTSLSAKMPARTP